MLSADSSKKRPPAPSQIGWAPAIVLIAIGLLGRLVYLASPVNSDTALFAYMGKMVSQGQRVGIELVDNKFPTVGLLFLWPYRILGAHWNGYLILGALLTTLASFMLARAVRRSLGDAYYLPTLVAAFVWLNFSLCVYGLLQLETFQICFASMAAACAIEMMVRHDPRDAFALGLCAGLCAMAKPTGLAVLGAAMLAVFILRLPTRQRISLIAATILGLLIPVAACLIYLQVSGTLEVLPTIAKQISDYATHSKSKSDDVLKPAIVIGLILVPILLKTWLTRKDRSPLDEWTLHIQRTLTVFAILWLLFEMIGIILQRRMYQYHFMTIAPPTALLFAVWGRRLNTAQLTVSLLPILMLSIAGMGSVLTEPDATVDNRAVIASISQKSRPTDRVWMDDYARLLMESNLSAGSRVPLTFLFANTDQSPIHFSDMILQDFSSQRPRFVVLPTNLKKDTDFYRHHMVEIADFPVRGDNYTLAWQRIDAFVRENYRPLETHGRLQIWTRDPLSSQPDVAHAE